VVAPCNLLLTGPPGIGKTTAIRHVVELEPGLRLAGFLTGEIRQHGGRVGFTITTLEGERCVMAYREMGSRHRVGRYGVDPGAIDRAVDLAFARGDEAEAFVVDEIGKMELLSTTFVGTLRRLLDDPRMDCITMQKISTAIDSETPQRTSALAQRGPVR
jgi:nucleoside-triphosphatase